MIYYLTSKYKAMKNEIEKQKYNSKKNIQKNNLSYNCHTHCNCECHKKQQNYKNKTNKIQIRNIPDKALFNLKLNQIPQNKPSNNYMQISKNEYECTFESDKLTNSTDPNQKIIFTSNLGDSDNNRFNLYRNDIKDFHIFIDALHKIKNSTNEQKNIIKSSSLKKNNISNKNDIYLNNNNKRIYKNLNLNYYDNEDINNKSFFEKDKKKYNLFSEQLYINNKKERNTINMINNEEQYSTNVNSKNNYTLNSKNYKDNLNIFYNNKNNNYEKFITSTNNRISPLGHIVDNFILMLKDKNEHRNKIIKKNYTKTQNYWNSYNKYNEDIMIKKKKLEDMLKYKNNHSCNKNTKNNEIKNDRKNKNRKIGEMKDSKEKNSKNGNIFNIDDNFNFSFNNLNMNNANKNININNKQSKNSKDKSNKSNNIKMNLIDKTKNENIQRLSENLFKNYIYKKKESIKEQIQKNKFKIKEMHKNNLNKVRTKENSKIKIIRYTKKNKIYHNTKIEQSTKIKNDEFYIETFNIMIQDNPKSKGKNTSFFNDDSILNNKSAFNQLSPSKFDKNIEIQNISNITYNPYPGTTKGINKINIFGETVANKVRKLIMEKAAENANRSSLSTKLNINTNLTLSESETSDNDKIKRNISISSQKSIFTIYYKYNKISILAFDYNNKKFSFHDFSDFGNFEENYKASLNENNTHGNNGNIFLNTENNLYIITGKKYDMLYIYDSKKKTMNKLCKLKNNHSNGKLLYYKNNIICLSGDFTKSVEIYDMSKNNWNSMADMLKERSYSGVCVLNNKYIINLFGYNTPKKKYLDDIEFYDMNNNFEKQWKCIECNFVLKIKNFFCMNNNDNKVFIVGGKKYSENSDKYNNNFIKIIFEEYSGDIRVKIEELIGKMKDTNKNKYYSNFLDEGKKYENNNEIFYQVFDSEFNCHVFHGNNNTHDIFYFNS